MGDDPMHVMMRQIMALFDEYQSKETAKHVLRAMRENARQGFWNGSLPPIGYRVVAAEQRGAKVKKRLEIDPFHAETVRCAAPADASTATPPMSPTAKPRKASKSKPRRATRSDEHTSELQSLMRTSDAVFCLKKKNETE